MFYVGLGLFDAFLQFILQDLPLVADFIELFPDLLDLRDFALEGRVFVIRVSLRFSVELEFLRTDRFLKSPKSLLSSRWSRQFLRCFAPISP